MSIFDNLVRRPAIRQRNDVAFVTLRSWRASCRRADLDDFKAEKRNKTPELLAAAAAEIAAEARLLFAPGAGWSVSCIACGHSRDSRCWGKLLAEHVAAALGLPFVEAFADRLVAGSSHPKEFKRLPPLQWSAPPASGSVLLIDDLVTSGWHLEEALRLLRGRGLAAAGIAWIGGTLEDGEPAHRAEVPPEFWPEWFTELPDWQEVARGLHSLDEIPVGPLTMEVGHGA